MRVSLNELDVRYARAIEAVGVPAGLAEDAAFIVARHDIWGLDGLGALAARLDALDGARAPAPTPTTCRAGPETVLDAHGASLLLAGPSALDLLEVGCVRDGAARLRIVNAADTAFAPGLAALAARRGLSVAIRAAAGTDRLIALARGGELALHRLAARPDSAEAASAGTVALAGGDAVGDCVPAADEAAPLLPGEAIRAREADAVDAGVTVDDAPWARIHALGARFLVSESDESRQRGAGGGSDAD